MTKKFGYKNVMEVPKLEKIVVNMGVGEAKENAKLLDAAIADMEPVSYTHLDVYKRQSLITPTLRPCGLTFCPMIFLLIFHPARW